MTKTRRAYTDEFKREAIQLLESSGKTARQLERELGIGKTSLSRWKRELEEKGKQAFPGQGCVVNVRPSWVHQCSAKGGHFQKWRKRNSRRINL